MRVLDQLQWPVRGNLKKTRCWTRPSNAFGVTGWWQRLCGPSVKRPGLISRAFTMRSATSALYLRRRSKGMRHARCANGMRALIGLTLRRMLSAPSFRELISGTLSDPDRRGCLIVNSALEVAPHDAGLRAVIASYLGEIEAFFLRSLQRARHDGDLAPAVDPKDAARLFLGILLGVRVAARAKPDQALLEGMVRPALALLDAPSSFDKNCH